MSELEIAIELSRLSPQTPIILLTKGRGVPEETLNLVDALVANACGQGSSGQPVVAYDLALAGLQTDPSALLCGLARRLCESLDSVVRRARGCSKISCLLRMSYLRLIIQPINAPAVRPTANVVAMVSIGCRWMR
jgi:hypothetical protein